MKKLILLCFVLFLNTVSNGQNYTFTGTGNQHNWPYGYFDFNWNTNAYKKFVYSGTNFTMPYRLLTPPNNDATKKYPLFVMLHGGGESQGKACSTDPTGKLTNECQLAWGGKIALDSSNKYPSFVFFPQTIGDAWWGNAAGDKYQYTDPMADPTRCVFEIIENILLKNYNIDPDRIYLAGLSNGGKGAWELLERRPDLFAAATPFCGMGSTLEAKKLINNPIWNYQGGKDNNPNPFETLMMFDSLVKYGGNPKRSLYVDRDHWVWVDAYQSKTWMNWIYTQDKKKINILYGEKPFVCPGGKIGLGISYGYSGYKWKKDGVEIPGATDYVYWATAAGTYTVSFQRKDGSWGNSFPLVVGTNNVLSPKPVITISQTSTTALESWQSINLSAPSGLSKYFWSNGATTQTINVGTAGSYSLNVKNTENACLSPTSETVIITKGPDATLAAPTGISSTTTNTSATITWTDNATTEIGYEVSFTNGSLGWTPNYVRTGANNVSLTISGLTPNLTYYYKVRAISNKGYSAYSSENSFITVTTANIKPVANAGADKSIQLPVNSVTISGTGTDQDGTITKYEWSKISGPAATLANTATSALSVTNAVAGTYVFRLTVTDNKNDTGFDDVILNVTAANQVPVANAGSNKTITLPTNSVVFNGQGTDADGTITGYTWTKVSGPAATLSGETSANLTASNLVAGSYVFSLSVVDNNGAASNPSQVSLTVIAAANNAPVVNAGADQSITLPVNSINLTGSATDSDGSVAGYAWAKLSGPDATITNANSATLQLSDLVAGVYTFRLTATDNQGISGSDDVVVTVVAPNQAPVVSAGADQTITLPASTLTIAGSASDADGTITSYEWTKVNGPTATLTGASTPTLQLSGLIAATYTFRLTVTDNANASSFDEVSVTVNPSGAAPSIAVIYLANAETGVNVDTLENGSVINLTTQPYTMTFIAAPSPSNIGSVQWLWDNNQFKTVPSPYSFTDNCWPGYICYNAWWRPSVGTHTLTAIPWSESQGQGVSGSAYTLTLNVIQGSARQADMNSGSVVESIEVSVSPNPVKDKVNVEFNTTQAEATLTLFNELGHMVFENKIYNVASSELNLSPLGLPSGLYFLQVTKANGISNMTKITKE